MATTVVSSNLLPLRSPYRLHGALQFIYALLIAALVARAFPAFLGQTRELQHEVAQSRHEPDPAILFIVVTKGLGLLIGALLVMKHGYGGLHRLLTFFVPAGIPGDLRDAVNTSRLLFVQRMFGLFDQRSALIRKAMNRFSPRLAYLTPPGERLLRVTLGISPFVLCALIFGVSLLAAPNFSFPWLLLGVVIVAKVVYALAMMTVMPRQPSVVVTEDRQHFDNTGNPANFFLHLEAIAQELRYKTFPNRNYGRGEPNIAGVQANVTSKFEGGLLFETQPIPRGRVRPLAAMILVLAGIAFGTAAIAALLQPPDAILHAKEGPSLFLGLLLTAVTALMFSHRFMARALDLVQVFHFESFLFWIDLKGTFTSSNVGVGDGRGGQFFAQRQSIQSDTYVVSYGARIVTECSGANALRDTRIIIDTGADERFSDAFAQFLGGMPTYKDSTTTLPSIAFKKQGVKEIMQANLQVTEGMARATAQANLAAPPPVPMITQSQPQPAIPPPGPSSTEGTSSVSASASAAAANEDGEWKVCPECGEKIRAAAKKCRFCNTRFDGATG